MPSQHPYGGIEPRFSPQELAQALGGNQPTEQQAEVIAAPLTPKLVVAGAGSGKTATMVDRVVWLVANGIVRPDQVLGVTFTRKAAGELRDRVRGRLSVLRSKGLVVEPLADQAQEAAESPGDRLTGGSTAHDPTSAEPTVLTYHSYANTLVRTYGLRIGVEAETVQLGQAQAWQMVRSLVESWDGEVKDNFNATTLTEQILTLSSGAAEHLLTASQLEEFADDILPQLRDVPRYTSDEPGGRDQTSFGDGVKKAVATLERLRILARMVERFDSIKRHNETMDFGDLLSRAARIAREDPAARALERERFKVVLLDEFQDTSHAQMVLFASLFGGGHSVMAVGDPQQSIYGFRGASAGQLFSFDRWFPTGTGERSIPGFLTTAWRNDTSILDTANAVAKPLRTPPPWAVTTGDGLQEVPQLDARPGAGAGKVTANRYLTDDDEAQAIAHAIQETRAEADPQQSYPTVAVLCRSRSQFEPIRRELAAAGIAYQVVGVGGLLEVPEVADVIATLQVLTDPGRSDALARLLTGARWRIGARDMVALGDWASHLERRRTRAAQLGVALEDVASEEQEPELAGAKAENVVEADSVDLASLVEAVEFLPPEDWISKAGRSLTPVARQRMEEFAQELHGLRSWLSEDLTGVLAAVERTLGLDIEVAARPESSGVEGRGNLDALQDLAVTYVGATGSQDVSAFLGWLNVAAAQENPDVAQSEPDPHAVQILTMHASKGLEWDHVYVPGLNQKDKKQQSREASAWTKHPDSVPWPLRGDRHHLPQWAVDNTNVKTLNESMEIFLADGDHHDRGEDRRLMYVAFTRARSHLALSCTVFAGTANGSREPSAFFDDLAPLMEGSAGSTPIIHKQEWAEPEDNQKNPSGSRILEAAWPYDPLEGPTVTEITAAGTPQENRVIHAPVHAGRRIHVERVAQAVRRGGFAEHRGLTDTDLMQQADTQQQQEVRQWVEEARVLLAAHQNPRRKPELAMPTHVSASTVVELGKDPAAVAAQLRRPMPRKPSVSARAGTTFHAWVEQYFDSQAIFDLDELPGGADDFVDQGYDLPALAQTFRNSEWGNRQPWAVEYPIETPLAGVTVRGRIDAVFKQPDGTWELVDWKSGRAPGPKDLAERAVQLAVYRLAWSRLMSVDLKQISAAFYFVGSDRTVRPHDLADETRLEAIITGSL
ncbi:ATP-dependent helicase [Kocuria sp.]|uniref:ATP-dependent helicase n=1 Tax=Kocuria sp. TaxID=1871328 RepID=UPI0026E0FF5D|nr:ATP-dependent DNA helicase [Kocuria sp.]MDO5617150.1 ATP-dependent DNA helicase [Kocuria sp.]